MWPPYVGVIVADSDAGDLWLRKMENPSHDSLSSGQLREEQDRRDADNRFRQARRELGTIIEAKAEIDRYGEASNLDELAGILPDTDGPLGSRTLTTRVVESTPAHAATVEIGEEVEEEGGGMGDNLGDGNGIGRNGAHPLSGTGLGGRQAYPA